MVEEKPFHLMGLPAEIRAKVFKYVYIQTIDQVQTHQRSLVRGHSFPYLACNIHLVCRLIFMEMVAFVASQRKIPVNIILPAHTTRDVFDGIVTKRLLCPAIGEVGLKFETPIDSTFDWTAELMLLGVYYIQQLQPSIPKLTIALRIKGCVVQARGLGHATTHPEGDAEIVVEMLTMKLVVQGSSASIVRPQLEQALDELQDVSNTTTQKYAPFVQWLRSNKGRRFKENLRSWESISDPRIQAFLAKQKHGGRLFGLGPIQRFNLAAPQESNALIHDQGVPRIWPRS